MKNSADMKFAIIAGAMKSGTSAVYSLLVQHPQICPCQIKEPQFFNKRDYRPEKLSEYYRLWDFDPEKYHYALEASTSYTKIPQFPNAAERIKESGIPARFIYIMRDPLERINSQIRMSKVEGWEIRNKNGEIAPHIIFISKYYLQISEYFKRFPKEDILLLSFEEFVEYPSRVMSEVCRFLNLDEGFDFNFDLMDKFDGSYFIFSTNRFLAGIKFLLEKSKALFRIFPCMFNLLDRIERKTDHFVKRQKPLPELEKQEIINILKEDMQLLKINYQFDTTRWKLQ